MLVDTSVLAFNHEQSISKGTRPDVYARSIQRFDLTSPGQIKMLMVSCVTTYSNSESDDDLFFLAPSHLVRTLRKKGKRKKKSIRIEESAILV